MLNRDQAKSFYNRFGNKQDWQQFYEGSAIRDLLAHGGFEKANAVFELGCGTGRFAAELLRCYLPETASYRCFDLSSTMVTLAGNRLAKYGDRARVHLTDGSPKLSLPDSQFDRFISNYVLDILPPEEIRVLLEEVYRILVPGGRLCLVSLTEGFTPLSQIVIRLWKFVFSLRASLLGGCRPVKLIDFISEKMWQVAHHNLVATWGIPSEVVVACKLPTELFIGSGSQSRPQGKEHRAEKTKTGGKI